MAGIIVHAGRRRMGQRQRARGRWRGLALALVGAACGRLNFQPAAETDAAAADAAPCTLALATLDLDVANAGVLDARIVVTRTTRASYLGDGGLIRFAPANVPRLARDPVSGAIAGLLVEESRTNLVRGANTSEELLGDDGVTVDANSTRAPDGAMTADRLIESPASGGMKAHYDAVNANANVDGTTYTWSLYAKAAERTEIALKGGAEPSLAYFDLRAGTVALDASSPPGTRASIEPLPDGWYRCVITYVRTTGTVNAFQFVLIGSNGTLDYQGDGVSGVYVWGAQAEVGAYPTSYIPTYGTEVTRAEDRVVLPGVDSLGVTATGTMLSEVELRGLRNGDHLHYELSDGFVSSTRIAALSSGGSTATNYVGASSVLTSATSTLPMPGQVQRNAFAFAPGRYAASVNGGPVVVLPGATTSGPPTQLTIGHDLAGANHLDGLVRRLRYFASPLTDDELQCLTR